MNIQTTLDYLNSPRALESLAADCYWPKWDSPWWHMTLLHEMGETAAIPASVVEAMVVTLQKLPLKIFPIHPEDAPPGCNLNRDSSCHCALGNMYQTLAAWGVDVDRELPWIRPWFLRYQMSDGGLNCDAAAYLVTNECPSSMVGLIAVFEAVLLHTPRDWTEEEKRFLDKGAQFLISRELRLGSTSEYNAQERDAEEKWLKVCFPRFYLYDVLRGLEALSAWSRKTGNSLPAHATERVTAHLQREFPTGEVHPQRLAYEGIGSVRNEPASLFPLLEEVSRVGVANCYLTRRWQGTRSASHLD